MSTLTFDVLSPHTPEGLTKCFHRLAELGTKGDYLEFGVYQGHSLQHAYREAQALGMLDMRFFAFDSFAGLPPPEGIDTSAVFPLQAGMFACSQAQVEANLRQLGVDMSRIQLCSGLFSDTLNPATKRNLGIHQAALVLIDCDLYASAKVALDFVADLLVDGSIVIFDDWEIFGPDSGKGEQLAFQEFLHTYSSFTPEEFVSLGWHGKSFILHQTVAPVGLIPAAT